MSKKILHVLVLVTTPLFVVAYAAPRSLSDFSNTVVSLADTLAGIIFALAFVGFLWGLILLIKGKMVGEKDAQKMIGKSIMNTGLVVLFIVASLWGILRIVSGTFFGTRGSQFDTKTYDKNVTQPYK